VYLSHLPLNVQWFEDRPRKGASDSSSVDLKQQPYQPNNASNDVVDPLVTINVPEQDEVWKATFSPDAQRILTVSNKAAHLWTRHGRLIATLEGPNLLKRETYFSRVIDWAMFNRDGERVLTASMNGMIWLWTIDGELVTAFLVEDYTTDNMFSATFSPNGQRILTTVRQSADLWDLDGRHLVKLPCKTNKVKRGYFSPDGDRISRWLSQQCLMYACGTVRAG
jgi:WD40 repeat protein